MPRVLIVDDEENFRKLYSMELTSEGYDVSLADSGQAAIRSVSEEAPDIVVLDVKMSGKDGLETLSELKKKNKALPVILNTAYNSYKNNFQSWLAEDYVIKSADLSELKMKIRNLLKI
ncbi:MAG: response regulator [candidate division Zixibacteria bacterium]|nr:response regulator [candidate division Zixibacteria bacterium]